MVGGLLSAVERKNGWWLAEQAGHDRPDAMQRLLMSAIWDEDHYSRNSDALDYLGGPAVVLAIPSSGH